MPRRTARLIYADSEHCADMMYATGLYVPDAFVWAQIGDEMSAIASPLEYGRMSKNAPDGLRVISHSEARRAFQLRDLSPASQIVGLSRFHKVKRWLVPHSFPLGLAQQLRRRGIECRASKEAFFPERAIKTAEEVEKLRAGVKLAEAGMYAAFDVIRASRICEDKLEWQGEVLTAERLRGEIDAEISRLGGVASQTIVAPGIQGADPHNAGSGPILANQTLILDIFPRVTSTGYFGDLTRTIVKGKPAERVKQAFEAVCEARDKAIAAVKPGVTGKSVHKVAVDTLEAHGFETDTKADPPYGFFHGTGHGVGLEIHEQPRVSTADGTLEAGHVHTVEPGVYYPDWGGIRLEDMVHVTESGCENLTSIETSLQVD